MATLATGPGRRPRGRSARREPRRTLPRRHLAGAVRASCAPRRRSTTREHRDYGPYWSVSTYKPIVEVESLPELYSSEAGGITHRRFRRRDATCGCRCSSRATGPMHTGQRRTVAPAFTPARWRGCPTTSARRTAEMLDSAADGTREFDWVDTVSIELTTQMLAILFDFPWEDRRKLTFWSDWAGDIEIVKNEELRKAAARAHVRMRRLFPEAVERRRSTRRRPPT